MTYTPPQLSDYQLVTRLLLKGDYPLHSNTQIASYLRICMKNSKLRNFLRNIKNKTIANNRVYNQNKINKQNNLK